MRHIVSVFFFLVLSMAVRAQTQGWFTYDTTNSAIPSSVVTCVQTDDQNAIWAGTIDGLARF